MTSSGNDERHEARRAERQDEQRGDRGGARWRAAAAADGAAITAMCLSLNNEDPGPRPMTPARIQQTLEALAAAPMRGQAVVLELDGGEPIGYALLVPFYSNEWGGLTCEVDELYVQPAHRSRGLGAALFDQIEGGAFGEFVAICLIATPENVRARRLYERSGFQVVGTTLARPSRGGGGGSSSSGPGGSGPGGSGPGGPSAG